MIELIISRRQAPRNRHTVRHWYKPACVMCGHRQRKPIVKTPIEGWEGPVTVRQDLTLAEVMRKHHDLTYEGFTQREGNYWDGFKWAEGKEQYTAQRAKLADAQAEFAAALSWAKGQSKILSPNKAIASPRLARLASQASGLFISDGVLIAAMIAAGFTTSPVTGRPWLARFNISQKGLH